MQQLTPPTRVLMGPGPSPVPASVLNALSKPTVGHLDPYFLQVMDEVREMLRGAFNTKNRLTFPMSGTGSAGMETCFVNLVEPGTRVLVGVNGVFGTRMVEVAKRCGAEVSVVEQTWGRALTKEQLLAAAGGKSFDILAVVHAETSTGVLQDLAPMREVANELGALLLVDAVTSLGGSHIDLDKHGVDAIYSGTQKCLSCPPGLAPISFSAKAEERLAARKQPVQSWYLDLSLIASYWGQARAYHHTAPINMMYALHEALRLTLDEGLEERVARHQRHSSALKAGLEAMGLSLAVPEAERLPQLTSVNIPEGVDDAKLRSQLLHDFGLEIGGGLGPLKGKTWRIGLMGAGATRNHVTTCLSALLAALGNQGVAPKGDPLGAAADAYAAQRAE
ncbi:MAG: alanine--glyoxylate aminotransferase family protein [Polyangiaceae bacterium]|nr:alanine--glyoxylate aminotransferase family protein [Polyangiaceae bacterium]